MVEMAHCCQMIRRSNDQDLMDGLQIEEPTEGTQLVAGVAKLKLRWHDRQQDCEQASIWVHKLLSCRLSRDAIILLLDRQEPASNLQSFGVSARCTRCLAIERREAEKGFDAEPCSCWPCSGRSC